MRVRATSENPPSTGADTIAVGLFDDGQVAHDHDGVLQALVDSGEAKPGLRKLALARANGRRYLLVGLGARDELTPARATDAAAAALARARELGTQVLCWEVPHGVGDVIAGALAEGTLLAAYVYREFKSGGDDDDDAGGPDELLVSAHHDVGAAVERATVLAEAVNAARDLQNAPANELTPAALARRAEELAGVQTEVWGREEIEAAGMGAFAAVARGSHSDPKLITLRYDGAGDEGPVLGFVGKAVTFDSGGISIKPAAKMHEMKFDMSGGAAVLAALGAIARLRLPVRVVGVIGATENLPSGHAVKPGDIVRAKTGTTIEVNNTDAEGRLVLADCLAHAREQGAERLVDLATLTGAMVIALGDVYAGLFATDDAWADAVSAAGERAGEPVWRLPLHADYARMIEGRYADIVNSTEARKAQSITAAEFLRRFTGDAPWAHLDIAGVADNVNRPWAPYGGTGWGVRLLVELAAAAG